MDIQIKRAYEAAAASDGKRVLVDRLWPRGVSKLEAQLESWAKDVAPSAELRMEFHQGQESFAEFARAYRAELAANPQALVQLRELAHHGRLTLVYASRDPAHNNAVVLRDFLLAHP